MNSINTIRVPCATRLTSLATNTTLGTATRLDFAAVTVNMPETTRTVRSAWIEVSCRDVFATAIDFDGFRCGIKIDAVAYSDTDYTLTVANTGDHSTMILRHDVTSYFVTNDPGTATFTAQVGVAYATGSASNVTGVCAVLVITYEYDPAAATQVKTVAFPIQCHHTTVSTSYIEVGTVSGTSNAPANQIPQLTGSGSPLLPESSISIKDYWLDISGMGGAGTTNTMSIRVDGSTDVPRFTNDQTLSTAVNYYDRYSLATTTTAAHAFEAKTDTGNMIGIGAVLWVTYTFDPTSATQLTSLQLPLDGVDSYTADTTSTDSERYQVIVDVQEPTTITMKQTGVVLHHSMNLASRLVLASGQAVRTYTEPSSAVRDGSFPIIHRCDHSSSTWTLARGRNRLTLDVYSTVENQVYPLYGGIAYVNYHSGLSASGRQAHARTTAWLIVTQVELAVLTRTNRTPAAPNIPETLWSLIGSFADTVDYGNPTASKVIAAERGSGEGAGAGWKAAFTGFGGAASENGSKRNFTPTTNWWRSSSLSTDPERMALETSRDWVIYTNTGGEMSAIHYVTHHSNVFAVAGTAMINGAAAADGKTIKVFAVDSNGTAELVTSTTVAGGAGAFTVNVPDSTRTYFASYADSGAGKYGRSLDGTPGTSTFDITIAVSGYSRGRSIN